MELKLDITLVIDEEEALREKQTPQQVTSMITTAIEMALEETGFCRTCLIHLKPKVDINWQYGGNDVL